MQPSTSPYRLRVCLRGIVQGVGFRPFVYRWAKRLNLAGWICNSPSGVTIEVEGATDRLREFLLGLERDKPPLASISNLEASYLDPVGFEDFVIVPSDEQGTTAAPVLPDVATCPECTREVFDASDRRYLYPFTTCTLCGPRYSIITGIPYDRENTTMVRFPMCSLCRGEYDDPNHRRFHAQANACPDCGPQLEAWDASGQVRAERHEALLAVAESIRDGAVVAVKGLGGFHLVAAAESEPAVTALRTRKRREEKPFALMYPSLDRVRHDCDVDPFEERLLRSPESPIVLLHRKDKTSVVEAVAPGNPCLGVMLPYTPLHHILLRELGAPVVATSGNLSDEPICTDEREALERLKGIADLFLVHNRSIARHVDDSIVRIQAGRELVLRRARGFAPLPLTTRTSCPPTLAVGAHLKNAVALAQGNDVFLSQHIGDLETTQAYDAFTRVIDDLQRLYGLTPEVVACDQHPDYLSSKYAHRAGLPVEEVQHHYAHVAACLVENEQEGPALGISWDGTGYGPDGTIWGGEFLVADLDSFQRFAHLRTFSLPGGEQAVKEPRRSALGLLFELFGPEALHLEHLASIQSFTGAERKVLGPMLERRLNAPVTSSAGRLFDGVASLLGIQQVSNYEGQAAMALEFAANRVHSDEVFPFALQPSDRQTPAPEYVVDWGPTVQAIVEDVQRSTPVPLVAAAFHNTLVESMVSVARQAGQTRVVLTGGCFQNRYLTERAVDRLREAGFSPYWHQRVPPNDGGIALGQAVAASHLVSGDKEQCV